ncbi:MAG: nucleotide exchange factor GrpE [Erysipelotrichales bacterium]
MSENNNEELETDKTTIEIDVENEEEKEVSEEVKLQEDIKDLQEMNKVLEEKYLLAYADAQNLAKRAKIDADNLVNNKVSAIVENILPALDNFERALETKVEDDQVNNFLKGFEMIYEQLYKALEDEGIKVIPAVGTEFDPNVHQAVMQAQDENYESNIVVEELQRGYTFRNKVIRPAMVKVNE